MLTLVMSIADIMDAKEKVISLYDRYYPLMCYIARENLPQEHYDNIDDIVQDALIDIMEYIDHINIGDDLSAKSLCILITKRRAIDFLRKKANHTLKLDDKYVENISKSRSPDILLDSKTTVEIVVNAISELDDNYRDVCRLKYINQMSEKQIAKLLKLTPKAVSMRIMRGKAKLRAALRKELYGE